MSRPTFILTPAVREDLLEIWNYIAEDSVDQADRVLARIYESFQRLAREPGMGWQRPDLADERHRFWTVYRYVIAYRWDTAPLEVVAVVHGARRLEAFFEQRLSE